VCKLHEKLCHNHPSLLYLIPPLQPGLMLPHPTVALSQKLFRENEGYDVHVGGMFPFRCGSDLNTNTRLQFNLTHQKSSQHLCGYKTIFIVSLCLTEIV